MLSLRLAKEIKNYFNALLLIPYGAVIVCLWNAKMTAKVLYVPSCFFVGAKFMEDRYIGDVTGHD